jgi:signal transduction histidine kinase
MNQSTLTELQDKLLQKEKELYSIQKIGQALSSTLNLDSLLNLIMKEITKLMDADRSTLYLVDKQRKEIWSKIALKAEVKEIRQKFGVGISGYVAQAGEKINIPDAYKDSRFDPSTDKRTGYHTRSILCIPVWEPISDDNSRQILGVIQVLNKKEGPFTEVDEGILEAIASEVAIAISNAQLYEQLEKKYKEMDLLYEYEQKLTGEYNLQEILKEFLISIINYFKGNRVGLIYPADDQIHFLHLNEQKITQHLTLTAEVQGKFHSIQNSNQSEVINNQDAILKMIQATLKAEFHYLKFIPIEFDVEKADFALLLLKDSPEREGFREDSDLQITDIIAQKIIRALELNMLRNKLLSQERLSTVGQMMSTIVHDLRGPVNNINGFLDLLSEEENTPEEREEFTQIMRSEIQSVTNMTTEILDFAKGKTSILPRKCTVKDIIKRFQPQIEQLFRNSNVNFTIDNFSKKKMHIDIEKFTRVLYNIAKNAKEAMEKRGNFFLKIFDAKDQVIFEMTDDGPGIPEEIRGRLFESFVTSGKESGTGLGLAIVRKIIEEHHGEIDLKSEVGKGTSFFIKIPELPMESLEA